MLILLPTWLGSPKRSIPKMVGMDDVKQLSLPNVSGDFMKSADVLLVLDDGTAIPCHSQILSLHSAVLCNMLADLASQQSESGQDSAR